MASDQVSSLEHLAGASRRPRVVRSALSRKVLADVVRLFDAAAILGTAALAFWAYPVLRLGLADQWDRFAAATLVGLFVTLAVFGRLGLYDFRRLHRRWSQVPRVLVGWSVSLLVLVLLAFLAKVSQDYSRGWLLLWYGGGLVAMGAARVAIAGHVRGLLDRGNLRERVAILGAGEEGLGFAERIQGRGADDEIAVVGFFDDRQTRVRDVFSGWRLEGRVDDLVARVRAGLVDRIVIALPPTAGERIGQLLRRFDGLAVDIDLHLAAPALPRPRNEVISLSGIPMLRVSERPLKDWHLLAKWAEDKAIAGASLIFFGPLMLLIALAIRIESPGPALFRQARFGFNNEPIVVYKFRTMYSDRGDPSGAARTVRGDARVTPLGRFLRRYSLDELPQLINVLQGSMSVVGPRAHPVSMQAAGRLYHEAVQDYLSRHRVKPGITGWAQVNGLRGEIDTLDKARRRVEHDLHYIENWSLLFDLRVLALTALRALRDPNAY
ncbi:Undecaprenyl-phosphate glucose phosphotransferase [Tistlia consotensis]|uniref:Undecaprenyl-phosphate glucose phosphotransferase n=1 Tax=Tistlia consotensis USBA 355 TaxID=560819 RepID=A0A1Y6BVV4_9PROT|nr:undecaprenyl-phosphate glucose phosphotransferase [Tistlia consotensis]SMF20994.1 Undecaprenyl-phosphate glucose phosphotransferase [Tistlia consotensis USBA 355]SNR47301.1 Undecaprenyl-phosphate glucose phosphotransferase [Tistlia consotensis]